MTDFPLENFTAVTGRKSFTSFLPKDLVIDVGRSIEPKVERNGITVGIADIDPDILRTVLEDRDPLPVRIVSQSVAPGVPVQQGTSVNLVLAPAGDLPLGIVKGVHTLLATETMDGLLGRFEGNPAFTRLTTKAANGTLTDTDAVAVSALFESANAPLSEQAGSNLDAARETLKALASFTR